MMRNGRALEARWKPKRSPKDSGTNRALGLCGSPECDEAIADLEDLGPPSADGQWQVTIRPGYIDAVPAPPGYDAPYLVFSGRWRDHRPMRSKERARALRQVDKAAAALGLPEPSKSGSHRGLPPTEPRKLGPQENVYVECKKRGCLAVTRVGGSTRWMPIIKKRRGGSRKC